MSERGSRKIPVTEREFLWVQDDDKGEVVIHVGPTMVSPTAADRIVVDDCLGGFRESPTSRQRMIEAVGDNQYAVLENPLLDSDDGPNGRFKNGRNESRPLRNGTPKMIPGPCSFWLRPGQRCEVRDAHELGSNQYLVVKVYGDVDTNAPYYKITRQSALIRSTTDATDTTTSSDIDDQDPHLTRGQLIVIRGLDTQFFIPPTGVDIVPDTSVDSSGARLTAEAARNVLLDETQAQAGIVPMEDVNLLQQVVSESEVADEYQAYDDEEREEARGKRTLDRKRAPRSKMGPIAEAQQRRAPPPPPPMPQALSNAMPNIVPPQQLVSNIAAIPSLKDAVAREARKARLIRDAVVLGEKEFCVVIDADGKRQIKVGPARVFPGPYDQFQVDSSKSRIFNAYELLPQRALWLRFVAPIDRAQLQRCMPRGAKLDQDSYEPGDEFVLTGVNTFFFPFNEIEILSPETGQPVFGNDHSNVFIEAIGIDQKSGIYVSDLATGEVRLVRGKYSYLVDPRKEVHVPRRVPPEDWNRWIAYGEPHKVSRSVVETWWALSVVVPPNTACMVTSANSERVVEGPCVTLLEYEERLVPLKLSTGVPKTDEPLLETCFLRVVGNRVSDEITVETLDFVEVAVHVSYSVTFQREKKRLWFGTENYVQVLCEHLRSLVRNVCRSRSLIELWPQLPTLIRDTILGEKQDDGTRTGRSFEDYGFVVAEVEVLTSKIRDQRIDQLMREMQSQSVALQIGYRQAKEKYESMAKRDELEVHEHDLRAGNEKRRAEFASLVARLEQDIERSTMRARQEFEAERLQLESKRELEAATNRKERSQVEIETFVEKLSRETEARVAAERTAHVEAREHSEALAQVEVALIKARSAATVAEREAVQAGLVEAMTALGDKIMLSEAAKNMNLVSLFQGKDVGTILGEVLGGTRVVETIDKMRRASKSIEE